MVLCSLFAALMAICAWIAIPIPPVSFTMQTFAVLLTLGVLGGKWGTASIVLYILLGAVGLPVFSGFRGGVGMLLGATGGYIWGFAVGALLYWALERLGKLPAMAAGLLACYLCGSWWFSIYAGSPGFTAAMLTCVVPYIIPDAVKLALAYSMSKRISRHVR